MQQYEEQHQHPLPEQRNSVRFYFILLIILAALGAIGFYLIPFYLQSTAVEETVSTRHPMPYKWHGKPTKKAPGSDLPVIILVERTLLCNMLMDQSRPSTTQLFMRGMILLRRILTKPTASGGPGRILFFPRLRLSKIMVR